MEMKGSKKKKSRQLDEDFIVGHCSHLERILINI